MHLFVDSFVHPLIHPTSKCFKILQKQKKLLGFFAGIILLDARGTQGGPGRPRGKPGGPQGALGTPSLAFPWVPLALPGCPWPLWSSIKPSYVLPPEKGCQKLHINRKTADENMSNPVGSTSNTAWFLHPCSRPAAIRLSMRHLVAAFKI